MKVTWWGHATAEIEDGGTRVLTDPVLRNRIAHLYRRAGDAPRPARAPDAVVVSHLHNDHCDLPSLRRLPATTRLIVPPGAGAFLRRALPVRRPTRPGLLGACRGADLPLTELAAGEETAVGSVRIRAVPAVHDGRRGGWSRARAVALGYLVTGESTTWFGGDTGLYPAMAELAPVDLALVPVWGWGWSLGAGHLDPARAAEAVRLVGATWAVPIHWGTLWPIGCARVRPDRFALPGTEFARYAAEHAPGTTVRVLRPGESLAPVPTRSTR